MRALTYVVLVSTAVIPASLTARPAEPADLLRLQDVSSPDISPDGTSIAYVVETTDTAEDKSSTHIWAVNWDGSASRQLTSRDGESESSPLYSPDGSQLAFLSSRGEDGDDALTRLWLLPLGGGEARPIEGIAGSVSSFAWSPDGKRLALVVKDKAPDKVKTTSGEEIPQPVVIDRFQFKQDGVGYLDNRRERIFVYDLAGGKAERLTDGDFDESDPRFSPDGKQIAFVSKRAADPDRTIDSNIFIADAASSGAAPRQLTRHPGADSAPRWSPDGRTIAYLRGGDPSALFEWYAVIDLASVPAEGGEERIVTQGLNRNVSAPIWSMDGKTLIFGIEDDGSQALARIAVGGGRVEHLAGDEMEATGAAMARNGRIALLVSNSMHPLEVHALDKGKLRRLSHHNDALMAELDLGKTERYAATSADGTQVHGFVTLPHGYDRSARLPTIMHLHGGPAAQYDGGFDMLRQVIAGAGYAVVAPNPRGSTGRGTEYAAGINAAWGSVDVEDVQASMDAAVAAGFADPDKFGVGGWSYGGMLTNYMIASDRRFKVAVSGASIGNIFTGYGTDHYVLAYEQEIGKPWENFEGWRKISYPFFENQRIVTPTLFMVGGADVNVPTWASEQMYEALKSREIDTQLVVYPGQPHGIGRPSFAKDRAMRWVGWFDKYLK